MFRYNLRNGFWYIDFANDNNIAQVRSLKMNLGRDKLQAYKYKQVPQGSFDVVDSTGTHTEPKLESFGSTVMLRYPYPAVDDSVPVAPEFTPQVG